VPSFDLADYLRRTGFSLSRLATYLQVAPSYLEAVMAGEARLTARDQAKCRVLWRRLFRGKQLELPFAEPPGTFTLNHARAVARAKAVAPPKRRTPRRDATGAKRTSRKRVTRKPASATARAKN
jgi:hypothetical protein